MLAPLVLAFVAAAEPQDPITRTPSGAEIRVRDATSGCFHEDEREYAWTAVEGGYRRGASFVAQADVDALRKRILAAEPEPKDLLARIGFTPAALAAHRGQILDLAWPAALREGSGSSRELPPEVERCLSHDALAPLVLAELKGANWSSTTSYALEIELPGDPAIKLTSNGLVAWKLPWTIEAAGKRWESCDLEVSKGLARLVDPDGPNAHLVDGTRYWTTEFWEDESFWGRFVGRELDAALCEQLYAKLAGYHAAMDRFRVEEVRTGSINLQPESLFLRIRARYPSTLDGAWWWNPLADGAPTSTWEDFASAYDAAQRCVEGHAWLKAWKAAGPDRTLEVWAVGRRTWAETMRDKFVLPPWKDAGFLGQPDVEILLRRGGDACGTVWLSSLEGGALIESARAGPGEHWFDRLELSFHPKKPTYGRVDAAGRFEQRTIGQ